jgi:hypothetical protein
MKDLIAVDAAVRPGSHQGVFHDVDDLVADEPPSRPERELLLRNVVFYSVAAFVGIYGRWRLRGERLSRRDVDSSPKRG